MNNKKNIKQKNIIVNSQINNQQNFDLIPQKWYYLNYN